MSSLHPHDSYALPDGRVLRMTNSNILVRKDKPAQTSASGLIHYPGNAMEHVNNTGTILAFGYYNTKDGRRLPLSDVYDLAVGLKCVFIRFLADQHTNEQIREQFDDDLIRLQPNDLQLVYDAEDHDRLFA